MIVKGWKGEKGGHANCQMVTTARGANDREKEEKVLGNVSFEMQQNRCAIHMTTYP